MLPTNDFFLDIWEIIKSYCPERNKTAAVQQLLTAFRNHGEDSFSFVELADEDEYLEPIIRAWQKELDEEDDEFCYDIDEDM